MIRVRLLVLALLLLATPAAAQTGLVTIQPSQVSGVAAATVTRNQVQLAQSYWMAEVLLKFTAGGTATGTLTIFVQDSCDGGTTWDDLISSNTFALGAAATNQRFFIQGGIATSATNGSAAAIETLAAGTARQGPFCDLWRVREKIATPSGSPVGATYTITAVFK